MWRWCLICPWTIFSIQLLAARKPKNWTRGRWTFGNWLSALRCGCTAPATQKIRLISWKFENQKKCHNSMQICGALTRWYWFAGFCRAILIRKTTVRKPWKTTLFLAQETNHEDLRGPNWTQQKQRAYPTTDCFASDGKSHALAWRFVAASWLDAQWKCLAVEVASYWKGWWSLAPFLG